MQEQESSPMQQATSWMDEPQPPSLHQSAQEPQDSRLSYPGGKGKSIGYSF